MNSRIVRSFGTRAKELFAKKLTSKGESQPLLQHARLAIKDLKPIQSVLVPFIDDNGTGRILLTKRSNLLRAHRGEICFPGGKCEANESMEQTALRETEEEIGLHPKEVDIWGEMDSVYVSKKTAVTPIVGIVRNNEALHRLRVNEGEVHIVMSLPVDEICSTVRYTRFKDHYLKMKMRFPVFTSKNAQIHFASDKAYVPREFHIWGLTACMLDVALATIVPGYESQLGEGWN